MDPRDINKVRHCISYVEKFIRHNRGNYEKAFEHMVRNLGLMEHDSLLTVAALPALLHCTRGCVSGVRLL